MRPFRATLLAAVLTLSAGLSANAATLPPQTLTGDRLTLRALIGTIIVDTDGKADHIDIQVEGEADELALIDILPEAGGVAIARKRPPEKVGRDWGVDKQDVRIHVTMPRSGRVTVEDMVGELTLGDLEGPLNASIGSAADITAGRLKAATLSISGAASVKTGDIADDLALSISGAGDIKLASVGNGARIGISGFGNIDVARMHGPVDVKVSGVGDVDMRDGDTDMLNVSISGLGGLDFEGTVREQQINRSGLASVTINGKTVE